MAQVGLRKKKKEKPLQPGYQSNYSFSQKMITNRPMPPKLDPVLEGFGIQSDAPFKWSPLKQLLC